MSVSNSRQLLIDAGMRSMLASGYGNTGLNQILELASVPKGSFYHHFSSKEIFAQEVVRQYAIGQKQKWEAILGDTKLTPLKRLRKYFRQMIKDHGRGANVSGCLLGVLSLEVADHSEALRVTVRDAFNEWQRAIAAPLSEAIDRGEISSAMKADELATLIISLWEGAHVRSKAELSDQPLEFFFKFVFDKLLHQKIA